MRARPTLLLITHAVLTVVLLTAYMRLIVFVYDFILEAP